MYVCEDRDPILRTLDRLRVYLHGRQQGHCHRGLGRAMDGTGGVELPRIRKLLPKVYGRPLSDRFLSHKSTKKEQVMELVRKVQSFLY